MNPILYSWQRMVHAAGIEMGVTLLVSGRRITGILTPIHRYLDWEREVFSRSLMNQGHFRLPSSGLGKISAEQQRGIIERWSAMEEKLAASDEPFASLCLRNAEIQEDPPIEPARFPLLLIPVEAVDAFMPGLYGRQELLGE